jgi:hypothetical protein
MKIWLRKGKTVERQLRKVTDLRGITPYDGRTAESRRWFSRTVQFPVFYLVDWRVLSSYPGLRADCGMSQYSHDQFISDSNRLLSARFEFVNQIILT